MKKSTKLLSYALGALFMSILIIRPYELNYNLDEEKGMKNIIAKINDLAKNDSVYEIHIKTQYEEKDMDFLTLRTINPETKIRTQISFNRSGAFSNSVDRKESGSKGSKVNCFDVSRLSGSLALIEECKKFIPESYKYLHTETISVSGGKIGSVKIAVAPEDKNDIKKNKYVHLEIYKKKSSSGGKRSKTKKTTHKYYTMTFNFNNDGVITPR